MLLTHQMMNYNHRFNQVTRVKSNKADDHVKVSGIFHSRSYYRPESNTVLLYMIIWGTSRKYCQVHHLPILLLGM